MEQIKTESFNTETKNWLQNFFIKLWKKIDKDDILNPVQQLAFDIFEICLNDENNVRYLNASNSYKKYIVSKRFITDKDVSTFILLENGKLTIVNHSYRYDIDLPQKTSQKMNIMFNDKVDQDREDMEKEIFGNIRSSLATVLSDFKGKLEETKVTKKKTQIVKSK